MVNTCTKQEVLDHFNLWVMSKYDWLGEDYIAQMMIRAEALLTDDLDYYVDAGHRVIYDAITEGF